MAVRNDLTQEAQLLNYASEKEMLLDLYDGKGFSCDEISIKLGYSRNLVRRRLIEYGANMRKRGGANYKGNQNLNNLAPEELQKPARELASKYNVHLSTVYKRKRKETTTCDSHQSAPQTMLGLSETGQFILSSGNAASEMNPTSTSTEQNSEEEKMSSLTTESMKESS